MNILIAIICLCLIGVILIELHAHHVLRMAMHRNVTALFAGDTKTNEQQQPSYDKTDRQKIFQHRVSPMAR